MLTCSCHNNGPALACLERHDSRTNMVRLAVSSFELTQRGHSLSPASSPCLTIRMPVSKRGLFPSQSS
jgi:hypothetical protein